MFDMRVGSVKELVNPEYAAENLKIRHPWVSTWLIRVSVGMYQVTDDLLIDIEDVMSTKKPVLSYLRITEEANHKSTDIDLSDLYQRRLKIFIQAKEPLAARDNALEYVVKVAVAESLNVCMCCGGQLEIMDLRSESQRSEFPFLPELPKLQIWNQTRATIVHVCMSCAHQKWIEINPFGGFALDDEAEMNTVDTELGSERELELKEAIETAADKAMANKIKRATQDACVLVKKQDAADSPRTNHVAVFSVAEVDKFEADYKDSIKDHATRVKGLVKKIRETSAHKDLIMIPDVWRDYCDHLEEKFPNFREVVGLLRTQMALSAASDGVLRLPPFLLLGDPGIGKTEFALSIATEFKSKLEIIDIASAQSGMTLSGSEAHWSNTQTGAIFNSLVFNQHANPIVLLDELDKARNDEHYNTLAVLHQVLEPRQAKLYRDLSVPELTLDASHIIWIGTANKADLIEKPILDRFVQFNIEPPSKSEMPAIVKSQYQRFIDTHPSGKVFDEKISSEVLSELCKHHPRKVRKILNQAFGLAALNERTHLTVGDIKASESNDKKKNSIGFAAEIN